MSVAKSTIRTVPFGKSLHRAAMAGPSPDAIQAWLVERLAKHLGVSPQEIDVQRSFASYGLGSMTAVKLSGELEKFLGRQVSPTLTWDYPTIEQAVTHLASEVQA